MELLLGALDIYEVPIVDQILMNQYKKYFQVTATPILGHVIDLSHLLLNLLIMTYHLDSGSYTR